jgi:membrane-associated protease RseP (regulator of RpoE activity)
MLLHSSALLSWGLRRWPALAGILGLCLAVGAAQVAGAPAARPEPKQANPAPREEEEEQAQKKAPVRVEEDDEDELPGLPGFGGAEMRELQRQMQRMQQDMMRQMQQLNRPGVFGLPDDEDGGRQQTRLGVRLERPSEVLTDQLDLPRDQGQVVREVQPDSAAARAGIKRNDVLLEVGGKAVSSDADAFRKLIGGIKANEAVDVLVLRKGKRETLKGLTLPKAPARARRAVPANPFFGLPQMGMQMQLFPGAGWGMAQAGNDGVMTTTFRNEDRFTTRHQEGSLIITVTGKVADGKAAVSEIRVQDGTEQHRYGTMDKVPERYRDKVKNLVEMSEKGAVRVEIKKP